MYAWYGRIVALALLLAVALPAQAQDWPSKWVRVICPYAAGSGADILVRYFTENLGQLSGQRFIVENKPGALTTIATEQAKRAHPDGYTMFITAGNSSFASAPHLFKELRYDPINDFAPITTLLRAPFILAVPAKSPINSLADLTRVLREKNGTGFHGSTNVFSVAVSELYARSAGFKIEQVPYTSAPQGMLDMLSGHTDFMVLDGAFASTQKDKLKFLAITSTSRMDAMPAVPTMIDSGIPDFDLTAWMGAWFPARTPDPIVNQASALLNQVLALEQTRGFLARVAAEPWSGSPASLAAVVPKEMAKWGDIIRTAKIELR